MMRIGTKGKMKLEKGVEIYYGGDMANREGFGVITKTGNIGYGDFVNITMEDGRVKEQIPICGFSEEYLGHGGTRFVTKEAWKKWRDKQIEGFRIRAEERENVKKKIKTVNSEVRKYKLKRLCDKITSQTITRLRAAALGCPDNIENAQASYKMKKRYIYIDVGDSGRYMVNFYTDEIFGIKAYGVIHPGHFYGTLDTIDDYYWGDYTAVKVNK